MEKIRLARAPAEGEDKDTLDDLFICYERRLKWRDILDQLPTEFNVYDVSKLFKELGVPDVNEGVHWSRAINIPLDHIFTYLACKHGLINEDESRRSKYNSTPFFIKVENQEE